MELVRDRERPVGELVVELQLDEATVSGHLHALREAAVVAVRQEGRQRWYGLRTAPLAELDAWLDRLRTD
jgi:DNA-binding transcriptional ArsR family regulator